MKRVFWMIASLVMVGLVLGGWNVNQTGTIRLKSVTVESGFSKSNEKLITNSPAQINSSVGSTLSLPQLGALIKSGLQSSSSQFTHEQVVMGITSHHLPTAESVISEFYKNLQRSQGPRQIFVILGPDHYEQCRGNLSTTDLSYTTPFGELKIATHMQSELVGLGVNVERECFFQEHAIAVHASYLKYLYPNSTIVPILFSYSTRVEEIQNLENFLDEHISEIFILGSIDFNHYDSLAKANESDDLAKRAIINLEANSLTRKMMDSPSSVSLMLRLAKKHQFRPRIERQANSMEFTGQTENTTSYMNVVFLKE